MPKLYEPSYNGQTPNVGGPRKSDELRDREVANFLKKKRAIKISAKRQRGDPMPQTQSDLAADLTLRQTQVRNRNRLLAMWKD